MNIVILKYILYTLPGLVLHWFTADRCQPVLRCTAGWHYIIPHREPSLQISAQQIGLSCICVCVCVCVCPLHGHLLFVPMMAVIQLQNLLLPLDLSCDSADDRSLLFWCAWNAQYSLQPRQAHAWPHQPGWNRIFAFTKWMPHIRLFVWVL